MSFPSSSSVDPTHPAPAVPPVSQRDMPVFADARGRREAGDSFGAQLADSTDGALGYHSVRPSYPDEVLELVRTHAVGRGPVVDVGAGTGKLTRRLLDDSHSVIAVDPSAAMIDALGHTCPEATAMVATAEAMPDISDHCAAAITCAQTWHWVDAQAAGAEFARILQPTAPTILAWNTLDVRIPWIHRLTRIMHAGDVQRPGFVPSVAAPLRIVDDCRTTWNQQLTPEQIILLARTRSYWLNAKASTREKVEANLRWYLFEHLEFTPGQTVDLTYRSDSFVLRADLQQ